MLQPQVTLKSGGYIIINQTEALVAIDVNSGRSTKEHSIEDTALQTNLEAAEEVGRQLRLRDLAGLIVIDFIDMEENRNNRAVEKRLKDCLKNDRARIQVGRISHFGLMEMSRQRIRASVLESTMKPCPHCGGTGHVRSDSSVALHVVRAIEEFLLKDSRSHITVKTAAATALYVLNHKRSTLVELERRFGVLDHAGSRRNGGLAALCDLPWRRRRKAGRRARPADRPAVPIRSRSPNSKSHDRRGRRRSAGASRRPRRRTPTMTAQADHNRDRKRRRRRRRRGGKDREPGAQREPAHRTKRRWQRSMTARRTTKRTATMTGSTMTALRRVTAGGGRRVGQRRPIARSAGAASVAASATARGGRLGRVPSPGRNCTAADAEPG